MLKEYTFYHYHQCNHSCFLQVKKERKPHVKGITFREFDVSIFKGIIGADMIARNICCQKCSYQKLILLDNIDPNILGVFGQHLPPPPPSLLHFNVYFLQRLMQLVCFQLSCLQQLYLHHWQISIISLINHFLYSRCIVFVFLYKNLNK